MAFNNETKHSATYAQGSKSASTFSNTTKAAATYANNSKNNDTYANELMLGGPWNYDQSASYSYDSAILYYESQGFPLSWSNQSKN